MHELREHDIFHAERGKYAKVFAAQVKPPVHRSRTPFFSAHFSQQREREREREIASFQSIHRRR
jgi:hypothetical protein